MYRHSRNNENGEYGKNSNETAKMALLKVTILTKIAKKIWQKGEFLRKFAKGLTEKIQMRWQKGPHRLLFLLFVPQAAQAHYVWVRASEVIWSEYTRIISVLSDAK